MAAGLYFLLVSLLGAEQVLILNSYHRGKSLSDQTINTIITDLQPKFPDLAFCVEDMDTKRQSIEELSDPLLTFYQAKYQGVAWTAVITVDNNAFDFAVANRDTLFQGAPIIFCGFNGFEHSILDGITNVTGVAETIDMEKTLEMSLSLHPGTKVLAAISDATPSGQGLLKEFRQQAEHLPPSLDVVELVNLTADDLLQRLKALPSETVVLRLSFFKDASGRSFRVAEQAELIAQAGLPVYDFWDEEGIGNGYVGGYVLTGESQGKMVSSMLERVLKGEPIERIEVVDRSPNIPLFDRRELVRHGADMTQLPPNADLRYNSKPDFLKRYRSFLIGAGILFILLAGLATFFAVISMQQRKHALALGLQKEELRATFESIGEGVITTNASGGIEQVNDVAQAWIGQSADQLLGRPAEELFQTSDGRPDTVTDLTSRGESPLPANATLVLGNGERLPIIRTASPIIAPDRNACRTIIVFRDMTRELELQTEMEQVRRLDALGQLAGGVAHDFNNMLGGIVGAAELLREELGENPLTEYPDMILHSAGGAAQLTTQLLSFARKQPTVHKPVHIHEVIHETLSVLRRTIDKRIEMSVRSEAPNDLVLGDKTLLHSSLLNLGINASHAMPDGGKLTFTSRDVLVKQSQKIDGVFDLEADHYIEILVEDTGTGIAPDALEHIFEPFFTTKEQGKGTGLGLAAVFGTLQQHRGSVSVESELGAGTRFTMRLPLVEIEATAEQGKDTCIRGTGVILLVDDEESIRTTAARTLTRLGYEVLTASNGVEALDVVHRERSRIQAIVLDMVMPKMSGRDCFDALQGITPEIPVIVTSGYASPEELQAMAEQGAISFIKKPYTRLSLSKAIHEAIRPSRP